MKKIFVFALSLLAVFFCSCKEKCVPQGEIYPDICPHSIDIMEPVQSSFKDGIYRLDFDIQSDVKGDAFLWLMLRRWGEDSEPLDFDDVHVYDFQIRAYSFNYFFNSDQCDNDMPTIKFPVFMKKINLPQNTSIHETIDIRLPDGFSNCVVDLFLFRTNENIEETKKTKLNPENYGSDCHFDRYYNCFPDSSLFSYLMTNDPFEIIKITNPSAYEEYTYDCKKFKSPIRGHSMVFQFVIKEDQKSTDQILELYRYWHCI